MPLLLSVFRALLTYNDQQVGGLVGRRSNGVHQSISEENTASGRYAEENGGTPRLALIKIGAPPPLRG